MYICIKGSSNLNHVGNMMSLDKRSLSFSYNIPVLVKNFLSFGVFSLSECESDKKEIC